MATLTVYQSIENQVWQLRFDYAPNTLSDTDKKLMQEFGEPTVQVGGTFLSGNDAFTLPNSTIRIKSDLPYTAYFDSTSPPFNTDTQTKVIGYRNAIVTAITTALTTLRTNADTFTGENTYNI